MHNYAGTDVYPATIPLIDDSDPPDASHFDPALEALADRSLHVNTHKLTKDGPDTITGAIDVASPGSLTVDAGAIEKVSGTLEFETGSTLQGTVTHGTLQLNGPVLIEIEGAAQIACLTPGSIETGVAGAIAIGVVGGIQSSVAGGVQATVAGAIASAVRGGIGLSADPNDFVTFPAGRPKVTTDIPQVCNPARIDGTNWAYAGPILISKSTVGTLIELRIPGLHHGARLVSITLWFVVTGAHPTPPTTGPSLFVNRFKVGPAGVVAPAAENLSTASGGIQQFTPWPPADGPSWVRSHFQQQLVYNCNQNNTIDLVNYVYWISLLDESGSGSVALNEYFAVTASYDSIPDMRFPS